MNNRNSSSLETKFNNLAQKKKEKQKVSTNCTPGTNVKRPWRYGHNCRTFRHISSISLVGIRRSYMLVVDKIFSGRCETRNRIMLYDNKAFFKSFILKPKISGYILVLQVAQTNLNILK